MINTQYYEFHYDEDDFNSNSNRDAINVKMFYIVIQPFTFIYVTFYREDKGLTFL